MAGGGNSLLPSPDGHSSLRKRFTAYLAEHLLARIQQLSSSTMTAFVKAFISAVQSKDVQVYLNASAAENALLRNHLADTI